MAVELESENRVNNEGLDLLFRREHLPMLTPHIDATSWFAGNPKGVEETAFRNSSMRGAYRRR